jgi:hypothetical protein
MAVVIIVMMAAQFVFLSTEIGAHAAMNQQLDAMKHRDHRHRRNGPADGSGMENARITGPLAVARSCRSSAPPSPPAARDFHGDLGGGPTYKQVFSGFIHSKRDRGAGALFTWPIA